MACGTFWVIFIDSSGHHARVEARLLSLFGEKSINGPREDKHPVKNCFV
jgi:hypothetical protein